MRPSPLIRSQLPHPRHPLRRFQVNVAAARNIRSEPITVNSTVADADTVNNAQTAAPTTEVTEAPAESEAEEVDTPATGDFPVPYLAAVLGLILVCSAGLVMLKRI